jgi:hypothetical protein
MRPTRKKTVYKFYMYSNFIFPSDFLAYKFDANRKYLKRHKIDSFYHISFMTMLYTNIFCPEDPPTYKPFMEKKT